MLSPLQVEGRTIGEKRVFDLLKTLPKDKFYYYAEPWISTQHGYRLMPDFVVILRDCGVVTLEVKDWVKILEGDQRQLKIQRTDGEIMVVENPLWTVQEYAFALNSHFEKRVELCERYKDKVTLKFPWEAAVILPNIAFNVIRQLENSGIWTPGLVMGKEALASGQHFADALTTLPWRWRLPQPLDNRVVNVIRGVVYPHSIVQNMAGDDIGTLTATQEKIIREPVPTLQPQQLGFFEETESIPQSIKNAVSDHSSRLIRGVSGSGKTLVLMQRARHLAQQYPQSNILVMTFNKDLAAHLNKRYPDIKAVNFHKLCWDVLFQAKQWQEPKHSEAWLNRAARKKLQEAGFSTDFVADEFAWRKDMELYDSESYLNADRSGRGTALHAEKRKVINQLFADYLNYQQKYYIVDWDDIPTRTLEVLQNTDHPRHHSYDVILIDEAQDFAPTWIKVIKMLLKPNGSLFICDDPTQSLFRYYSWRHKGIDVVGRTRILRVPFRCSRQISEAAYTLIHADPILSKEEEITVPDLDTQDILDGTMPALINCIDEEQEINFIRQQVNDLIKEWISPDQIAVLCPERHIAKAWDDLRQAGVYVEHYDKMKGLEFTAVFLPSLHVITDSLTTEIEVSQMRRRIFTAMTRARHILLMAYQQSLPETLKPIIPKTQHERL